MSTEIVTIFLFIGALQSALIHWHNFSPFERECNWQALILGAKPALRFWAVVVLDLCVGILLVLLALCVLPHFSGIWDWLILFRILPVWLLINGMNAVLHHYVNDAIVHFPNFGIMAPHLLIALLTGFFVTCGMTFMVIQSIMGNNLVGVLVMMWQIMPVIGLPAFFFGLMIFILSSFTFFLRIIPLIGNFLQAIASTGLLLWYMEKLGYFAGQALGITARPGINGLENIFMMISVLALCALLIAWRLPGQEEHPDGVEPPSLLSGTPQDIPMKITELDDGVILASNSLIVQVSCEPFNLIIQNQRGETLAQIDDKSIKRELFLYQILSIPILYTGNTIKFKWHVWDQPVGPLVDIREVGNAILITLYHVTIKLSFFADDILRLSIQMKKSFLCNAVSLTFPITDDAHFLGFGQRFNRVDQRGRELYFLVEEGGVGYATLAPLLKHIWGERGTFPNGEFCTSFPVPFALIAREHGDATGWFWNTYKPSWFKTDRATVRQPFAQLTVLDDYLDIFLCAGITPLDAIRQYTGLTGRPIVPPPWVLLPWKTRTGAMSEADVLEDIHKYRQLNIPIGQVGVENWQVIRGSYEFNERNYPHIDDIISQAHTRGQHIQIWHFPYMNKGSAVYKEGIRQGYFLRNRLGLPYQQRIFHGIATVIDYSNPRAAQWHEAIVRKTIYARGFSGTMTDYGESIPPDCVFYNGKLGLEMRNAYSVMYCQSMQRAAQDARGDDYLIYPRAGYAASQRYITAQFPGDQDTDWDDGDGLPAAVRAMLNVSMSGFPLHGSDIGGWLDVLTPITTKELFIRWAEVGAYSPLMRAHGGLFGRNREPWKFDEETIKIYAALSHEHVRLFPYLYSLIVEASKTGKPIVIHPALLWPDRSGLYEVEDAWMLGEALYIAPVVRKGWTKREVILPPGEWWDLNANQTVHGLTRLMVDAPLGSTPRFLRRGYLLPRFVNSFDTFDEGTNAHVGNLDDDLEVWLFPDDGISSFKLFDGSELHSDMKCNLVGKRRIVWKIFG